MPFPKEPARAWVGTWNTEQPYMHWEDHPLCRYAVFQYERGETTGNLHFQWYAEFKKPCRAGTVTKLFPGTHIEYRLKNSTRAQARAYCMKEDTRVHGPYEYGKWENGGQGARPLLQQAADMIKESGIKAAAEQFPMEFIRYHRGMEAYARIVKPMQLEVEPLALYSWQAELMDILNGPIKHRTIYWIWSETPAVGKTTFAQYVASIFGPDKFLNAKGDARDILYAYNGHKIIWWNIPRQTPLDAKMTSMLEDFSDGGFHLSSKYDSHQKIVKAHIVVTCNRSPPTDKLPDRIREFFLG